MSLVPKQSLDRLASQQQQRSDPRVRGAERVGGCCVLVSASVLRGLFNTVDNTEASLSIRKLATELFGAFLKRSCGF